jgi:hypothetical protein
MAGIRALQWLSHAETMARRWSKGKDSVRGILGQKRQQNLLYHRTTIRKEAVRQSGRQAASQPQNGRWAGGQAGGRAGGQADAWTGQAGKREGAQTCREVA